MLVSKFKSVRSSLYIAFTIFFISFNTLLGQQNQPTETSEEIVTAIYQDIWLPFMESYRELSIEKFQSVHAKDLTRVSISRNRLQSYDDYFPEIKGFFQQVKDRGRQIDIRFAIVSTANEGDKTYQTGYYCFGSRASDSEEFQPRGYGFFNVLLTKEGGTWKISLDADDRSTITEEEFIKAGIIYGLN